MQRFVWPLIADSGARLSRFSQLLFSFSQIDLLFSLSQVGCGFCSPWNFDGCGVLHNGPTSRFLDGSWGIQTCKAQLTGNHVNSFSINNVLWSSYKKKCFPNARLSLCVWGRWQHLWSELSEHVLTLCVCLGVQPRSKKGFVPVSTFSHWMMFMVNKDWTLNKPHHDVIVGLCLLWECRVMANLIVLFIQTQYGSYKSWPKYSFQIGLNLSGFQTAWDTY